MLNSAYVEIEYFCKSSSVLVLTVLALLRSPRYEAASFFSRARHNRLS